MDFQLPPELHWMKHRLRGLGVPAQLTVVLDCHALNLFSSEQTSPSMNLKSSENQWSCRPGVWLNLLLIPPVTIGFGVFIGCSAALAAHILLVYNTITHREGVGIA